MSDEVHTTAPVQPGSSESSIAEAGARRLAAARIAAPATTDQPASPQATATTAAVAESPLGQQQNEPDGTLPPEQDGKTSPEQTPPAEPEDSITVSMADGTTRTLTRSQIRDGIMLKEDHTQKTQAVAQERGVLKSVIEEAIAHRETAARMILERLPQVDPELEFADESRWVAQVIRRQNAVQEVKRLREENATAQERVQQIDQHEFDSTLVRLLPHLAKPGAADQERDSVVGYVRAKGWPEASIERARRDPFIVAALAEAARFQNVRQGGAKGGQASAAARLQPSPTIAQVQIRPPPVGTARSQQQGQMRSGDAVRTPTRPGGGLRAKYDQGAARLSPIGR